MAGQEQAGYNQAGLDQLEIIGPDGQIWFYDLDAARGITNIGSDPNNDLVVDAPGVATFHAVLDHRQRPYQVMLLSVEGNTRLRGQPVPANVFQELHDWDTLEIDGHSIVLLHAGEAPAAFRASEAPAPFRTPEAPASFRAPESPASFRAPESPASFRAPESPVPLRSAPEVVVPPVVAPPSRPGQLPRDQRDELIVTEVSGREWTVDVEQTATCQLTIINGGSIVASFYVAVEGIPEEWVTILPPRVNLNEGARTTVSIAITPPRAPASRAGVHPLVIAVTSPNYPGHTSRTGATLFVNPYYAFTLGEISPKQQTVSWRTPTGHVTVPITNDGNSETPFRVDGEDEERGCRFEFEVPDGGMRVVRQAEVRLKPEQMLTLPIDVTPIRRRLIGLRKRNYSFTVTTTMLEGAVGGSMPRSIMARLSARPLIGPPLMLLILVSLLLLIYFLGQPPRSPELAFIDPGGIAYAGLDSAETEAAAKDVKLADQIKIQSGQDVVLDYKARRFTGLGDYNLLNRQNELFLRLTLEFKPAGGAEWVPVNVSDLQPPKGTVVQTPVEGGEYQLLAENWLSSLFPNLHGTSRPVTVQVDPVLPRIARFDVDRDTVYIGESVQVFWDVRNADSLTLRYFEGQTLIQEEELAGADLKSGRRTFPINAESTFTLEAANNTSPAPDDQSRTVRANPRPANAPIIVRFDVAPLEITQGDAVQLAWEVTGADTVSIEPLGDVPHQGERGDEPKSRTTYQLVASKMGDDGKPAESRASWEVIVNTPPPPTPEPEAPVIDLFEAIPKEVIAGEAEEVELTWSVLGHTTAIEITTSDLTITGLAAQDLVTVTVNETTLFVLTASNGDLKTSKAIEIKAIEPTPTPEPTLPPPTPEPSATPEPTPTPFPLPIISYFTAEGVNPADDKVVFLQAYNVGTVPWYKYEVQARSHVRISWGVKNADVVILENFGPQPPEGELDLPEMVVANTEIELRAQNNEGKNEVAAVLQFEITAPPAPPPPPYVTGVEDKAGGKNTLMWSYSADDEQRIDGFRVYRAEVPPGATFVLISDLLDPSKRDFVDEITPTCGLGYYVVAVYTDPETGAQLETAASLTSWYSRSCQ